MISSRDFEATLRRCLDEPSAGTVASPDPDSPEISLGRALDGALVKRLWAYHETLVRWQGLTSLIGPGTEPELVSRHFAESLSGLRAVESAVRILDFGSGAGFPGLVLAAAHSDGVFHLVEAQQRKAAFLRQAAFRMDLDNVYVHACRLEELQQVAQRPPSQLVEGTVDCLTLRAIRLTPPLWRSARCWLARDARVVRWEGKDRVDPVLPLERVERYQAAGGGSHRSIVTYRVAEE